MGIFITRLAERNKFNNIFLILLIGALIVLNRVLVFDEIGIIFSYFQFIIVLLLLLIGNTNYAVYIHLVFTITALEFVLSPDLILHSYRTTRILGISVSTLALIILYLSHFDYIRFLFRSNHRVKTLFYVLIIGLSIGTFGVIFLRYELVYLMADFKYWLVVFLSTHLFHIKIVQQRQNIKIYKRIIIIFLGINVFVNFLAGLLNITIDNYGGVDIFVFDSIGILSPILLLLYSKHNDTKINALLIFVFILGILNTYFFNTSGKGIIISSFIFLFFIYKNFFKERQITIGKVFITFIIVITLLFLGTMNQSGKLFENKLGDSIAILSLNWIANPMDLSASPRDRVIELMNISTYLSSRPLLLLFGVGFGGYYEEDYIVNYTANADGGYSDYEIKTRKFINPHMSLNRILLKFGLFGLFIWIYAMYNIVRAKNYDEYSKYILFILLFIFIGYSLKFGLMIGLFLNLYEPHENNINHRLR